MTDCERAAVRRLLWRWGRFAEFCDARQRELDFYADKLESSRDLGGRVMDGQPHGSGISDPTARVALSMDRIIDSYAELVEKIGASIENEKRFKLTIDELINALPREQRRIIELRYIDGHQWAFIGMKMVMDERTAQRLDEKAVEALIPAITIMGVR